MPTTTNQILDLRAGEDITVSGSEITNFGDFSPAGNDCTGETGASSKPLDALDAVNEPVFRFDYQATHPKAYIEFPASMTGLSARRLTVYVVCTNSQFSSTTPISFGNYPRGHINFENNSNTTALHMTAGLTATSIVPPINKAVYGISSGPSGCLVRYNNTQVTLPALGAQTDLTGGSFGRFKAGNSQFWSGDAYRILAYDDTHDQSLFDDTFDELIEGYNVFTAFRKQLVIVGDSRPFGVGSTDLKNFPNQMVNPSRNWTWECFNVATPSQQIAKAVGSDTATALAALQVDGIFRPGFDLNAIFMLEGTNDFAIGLDDAATVWAEMKAYADARKAAHPWVMGIFTELGRGSIGGTVYLKAETLNATLRLGYANIDYVPDVGVGSGKPAPIILDNGLDTDKYVDQVHLTNYGYLQVADEGSNTLALIEAMAAAADGGASFQLLRAA